MNLIDVNPAFLDRAEKRTSHIIRIPLGSIRLLCVVYMIDASFVLLTSLRASKPSIVSTFPITTSAELPAPLDLREIAETTGSADLSVLAIRGLLEVCVETVADLVVTAADHVAAIFLYGSQVVVEASTVGRVALIWLRVLGGSQRGTTSAIVFSILLYANRSGSWICTHRSKIRLLLCVGRTAIIGRGTSYRFTVIGDWFTVGIAGQYVPFALLVRGCRIVL